MRQTIDKTYDQCRMRTKIELKAWSHHSEKSYRNGNFPLPFMDYVSNMSDEDYLKQVQMDILDCGDLGGKEEVIKYLMNRINR